MHGVNLARKLVVSRRVIDDTATDVELGVFVRREVAERLEFIILYGVCCRALQGAVHVDRECLSRLVDNVNYLIVGATREGEISVSKLVTVCRRGQVNGVTTVKAETNVGRICLSCSSNPLRRVGSTH